MDYGTIRFQVLKVRPADQEKHPRILLSELQADAVRGPSVRRGCIP